MTRHEFRFYLTLALFAVVCVTVFAASHTLTYTAAQDTDIQQRLIPMVNRTKCALYGLPKTCSTAQVQAPTKCVTRSVCQAAGLRQGSAACTRWSAELVDACVIFTSDAAGEAAYLKEAANSGVVNSYALAANLGADEFCTNWDLMSAAAQDTTCTTAAPGGLGLSAGCRPCPESN
jgi:hypothetical protein